MKSWYRSKIGKFEKFASILSAWFQLENWNASARTLPSSARLEPKNSSSDSSLLLSHLDTLPLESCAMGWNNFWRHIFFLQCIFFPSYSWNIDPKYLCKYKWVMVSQFMNNTLFLLWIMRFEKNVLTFVLSEKHTKISAILNMLCTFT